MSLLEKAKATKQKKTSATVFNEESFELLLAALKNEVNVAQVGVALGVHKANAVRNLWNLAMQAFREGRLIEGQK